MKYLFEYWEKLKENIDDKYILLFLDYDGTLTPIVNHPQNAVLPEINKNLLTKLSKNHRCRIILVTGRSLEDIKKLIGIKEITYFANHGLEIESDNLKHLTPVFDNFKTTLSDIKKKIECILSSVDGILIEDKKYTLSVHYRLVEKNNQDFVKKELNKICGSFLNDESIKVREGKKVFEILPPVDWNKGKIVLWFLDEWKSKLPNLPLFPVYIGDDITDEDAFKALKDLALTVVVGETELTNAQYYLKNTQDSTKFLESVLTFLEAKKDITYEYRNKS